MRYALQMFQETGEGNSESLLSKPIVLNFTSVDNMQSIVRDLADKPGYGARSLSIEAEDGAVEKWSKRDGTWTRQGT